jgi:hypothetical protein
VTSFLDRRSAERFAELLDETITGRHQSRGQADEHLAELVAIGQSLSAARPGVRVDSEFRAGLRAMLVATAERDGIGRTATDLAEEPDVAPAARGGLLAAILGQGGRRIRARGAIVIGVAAGALAVSGISAASESASPGDALYPVKRSTERAQLAMAGSDVTRGQLSLDFARTRLAEAASMPGDAAGFAGVLVDMDADTRKGVRLLDTSAVARRDVRPLATVDAFAGQQRQALLPVLGKLSPGNRERADASLDLLEDVRQRTASLRAGLNCTPVQQAGADALGPKLRDCATTAGDSGTARPTGPGQTGRANTRPGGKDTKAKPARVNPTATPGATSGTAVPRVKGASAGPDLAPFAGTPMVSESPAGTQPGDGVVGGLLGGIVDGN